MKKYLIAANWKMNKSLPEALDFCNKIKDVDIPENVEVLICPPFPLIYPVSQALQGTKIATGAQNAYFEKSGAFTGETSIEALKSVGAEYIIIGHSERRNIFKEPDELLNKKLLAVLNSGLKAIFCIGELIDERKAGKTISVITKQLDAGLKDIPASLMPALTIAYEPVWAIGTGLTATPAQAEEVHSFIRNWIKEKYGQSVADALVIQYGGSVKPENVKELMSQPDIDGALVGGAALVPDKFEKLIHFSKLS